jgi:integrase
MYLASRPALPQRLLAYAASQPQYEGYRDDFRRIFARFEQQGILEPRADDLLSYAKHISSGELGYGPDNIPYSQNSVNYQLSVISALLRCGATLSRHDGDVASGEHFEAYQKALHRLRTTISNSVLKPSLTRDQVREVMVHCAPDIAMIVKILFATGLRISELLTCRIAQASELPSGHARLRILGKRNKTREVFLPRPYWRWRKAQGNMQGSAYLISRDSRWQKPISRITVTRAITPSGRKSWISEYQRPYIQA